MFGSKDRESKLIRLRLPSSLMRLLAIMTLFLSACAEAQPDGISLDRVAQATENALMIEEARINTANLNISEALQLIDQLSSDPNLGKEATYERTVQTLPKEVAEALTRVQVSLLDLDKKLADLLDINQAIDLVRNLGVMTTYLTRYYQGLPSDEVFYTDRASIPIPIVPRHLTQQERAALQAYLEQCSWVLIEIDSIAGEIEIIDPANPGQTVDQYITTAESWHVSNLEDRLDFLSQISASSD